MDIFVIIFSKGNIHENFQVNILFSLQLILGHEKKLGNLKPSQADFDRIYPINDQRK